MALVPPIKDGKKDSDNFTVELKYNNNSNKFFIDFSNDKGVIISVLITEGVATGLGKSLNLKILI